MKIDTLKRKNLNRYQRRADIKIKTGESMTLQDHRDECDINIIVKRGLQSGYMPSATTARRTPMFGDFTSGNDFQEAQDRIANIKSDFMLLPSEMREAFDNDPAKLVDALSDPTQKDFLLEHGVLEEIERQQSEAEEIGNAVAKAIKDDKSDTPKKD